MSKNIKKISSIVIASHNPGKIREMLTFIKKLNTKNLVLKAQIHPGGRGKEGGIKLIKNTEELIK